MECLICFVKDNFLAGRVFVTITELNLNAIGCCNRQKSMYNKTVDCMPQAARIYWLMVEWDYRADGVFNFVVSYAGRGLSRIRQGIQAVRKNLFHSEM